MRPVSEQRDRVEKRRAYAEAGILVYLPIDCDTCEVVSTPPVGVTLDTESLKD
ncbi:hypothetical protein AB0I54_47585 [Streptomyces sp. NPDC050625]|uniref:hypothetical protein n=1 Tax=Streptomyces sp. NPDC050625 TaxID=3154629 RepID=UPI00343A3F3C